VSLDSFKVILMFSEVTFTDKASKPTILILSTSPILALILKLPSKSVSAEVLESAASTLYWIDKCGHAAMMEHPDEFNRLLEDWLTHTHLAIH